jgi:hypothetical protein
MEKGHVVEQLAEALRYKPEDRGFDSRWGHSSGCIMGSTQSLKEMSTRGISWVKSDRCVGLTTLQPACADCLEIMGASNFWSPKGLIRPL